MRKHVHVWTKMDKRWHTNTAWARLGTRVEGRAACLLSSHLQPSPSAQTSVAQSHANVSAGKGPARAREPLPRWHMQSCVRHHLFLLFFFLARSPAYDNGPWKSRVSLCCLSCPASVFRMSEPNIIICVSVYCFACITRCFCALLLGQWDRKLSKVKLAARPTHDTACCEKCGNEIFDQCGNCNRDFGDLGHGNKAAMLFFIFSWRLEQQGR